jgi:perosamine synthetase
MKKIKWFELDIGNEETEAVTKAVADKWISGTGPHIKEFERKFAEKVNAKYGIAVCNGTCGLIAILLAYKHLLNQRMPIIAVPTWTYFATVTTADLVGKIKFIDCDKQTFNMLPKIPRNTDIIMPVDVGGMPIDYDEFLKYDLPLIVDSAESIGSSYKGKPIGSIAPVHLFSLHAAKLLTTGEGGMITTSDPQLYEIIRQICNQGYASPIETEYIHQIKGFNFRMTTMQAAIGLVQLDKLERNVQRRREIMRIYGDILGSKVDFQFEPSDRKSSFWLATILVNPKIRDGLVQHLIKNDIEVKVWRPAHLQPPFVGKTRSFRNAEWLYHRNVNLPVHNLLSDEDAKIVAETIKRFIR